MVTIILESHATSVDNETGVASGHRDVPLSDRGRRQAAEMGERYAGRRIDAVYCSDLQRAYETAEIAFAGRDIPIVRDRRLRECDYGDFTGRPRREIAALRVRHVTEPFPGGESVAQAVDRIRDFLRDLHDRYDGKTVLIVGHIATHEGLEHWISGTPLEEVAAVQAPWQPGWTYVLSAETLRRMEARV